MSRPADALWRELRFYTRQAQRRWRPAQRVLRQYWRDPAHRAMLYGGYALHLAVPAAHIYEATDLALPDIDLLVVDAIAHAEALCARLRAELPPGAAVVARSAVHIGTLKLLVDGVPLLDLTELPPDCFEALWRHRLRRPAAGWTLAPLAFLQRNLHLELAAPEGARERIFKVFARLERLDGALPFPTLVDAAAAAAPAARRPSAPARAAWAWLRARGGAQLVLVGGQVSPLARSPFGADVWAEAFHPDPLALARTFQSAHPDAHAQLLEFPAREGLRPALSVLACAGAWRLLFWHPDACWQTLRLRGAGGAHASLDTVLALWLGLLFDDSLPVAPDVAAALRAPFPAVVRRTFQLSCVGHQPTLHELKRAHQLALPTSRAFQLASFRWPPPPRGAATRRRAQPSK